MKIGFISLGCAKALVDSEIMMGKLREEGHTIVPSLDEADLVVINTCAFLREARKESLSTIEEVVEKGKPVVVAGCMVNWLGEELRRKFPSLISLVGTEDVERITEAIKGKIPGSEGYYLPSSKTPRFLSTPPSWVYMKISEGCSRRCSFCIIPKIRGPYRSREINDLVQEAKILEERGVAEINLISQDSTYFGKERGENLKQLLEALLRSTRKVRFRLLYLYPSSVVDEILPLFSHPRLLSYFDIPFQHSHPEVLRSMGRPGSGEDYLRLIEKIRQRVEDATIRTSLIVGFPTEGREEFRHLVAWVKRAEIDRLGVFKYSREKGSSAWPLGDPVSEEEKEKRVGEVLEVQREISLNKHRKMVGRVLEVLVEGKVQDGIYFARSSHFAPEVDGGIYVLGELKGPWARVKITHAHPYDLEGEAL